MDTAIPVGYRLPTMRREDPPEFVSWKEIANRIGRSVRTVQEWEKERGLPVERRPGKHGGVFLRRERLEQWMAREEAARIAAASSWTRRRTLVLVAGITLALGAIIAWRMTSTAGPPASWNVAGDSLIVADVRGVELWRTELEGGLTDDVFSAGRFAPQFVDLDDNGSTEVLFVHVSRSPGRSDTLVCFSSDGTELWRYRPGRVISTAQQTFDEVYWIKPVKLGRFADGSRMLVVASHHRLFYPSSIAVLTAAGELVADYWHAGHIGVDNDKLQVVDLDQDGHTEIYAAGVNNARDLATLVVLDPETMGGAGVESNVDYQFRDLPPGRGSARLFFRRSSVSLLADRFNVAYNVIIGPDGITVAVRESILVPASPSVFYDVDPALRVTDVSFSDTYIGAHKRFLQEGRVRVELSQELEALRDVEVVP